MARTDERGGPQTRARIAAVAAGLFVERGFESVTVADIARAAGVSSVTVFKHFPRKEDLFLDRSQEAEHLLRAAVHDAGPDVDVLGALEQACLELLEAHHPLSGTEPRSVPFFRTVAASPALLARAREIASELQGSLAADLRENPAFEGDAALLAAFFVGGYTVVLLETARRQLAGDEPGALAEDHRVRLGRLFAALRGGVAAPS